MFILFLLSLSLIILFRQEMDNYHLETLLLYY